MEKRKSPLQLTDEELESCVNGTTNIRMLRSILVQPGVIGDDGLIDPEIFADWFAQGIEAFIDADVDTDEWITANDVNWNWGYDIGDNINTYITDNFKED